MWEKYRRYIAAVFYLIAFAVPMTPIAGTTLGYILLFAALLLALGISAAMIWDASAGVRYVYIEDRHTYSKYEKRIRYSLVGMFLVIALLVPTVAYLAWNRPALVKQIYMTRWARDAANAYVTIDGRLLSAYSSQFKLAAVFFKWSGNPDFIDVEGLQKSNVYEIRHEAVRIVIALDQEFLKTRPGANNFVALLIPNALRMDQFSTLRQAYALGAIEIGTGSGGARP